MIGYQFSSFSNDHQDDMPYWILIIPPHANDPPVRLCRLIWRNGCYGFPGTCNFRGASERRRKKMTDPFPTQWLFCSKVPTAGVALCLFCLTQCIDGGTVYGAAESRYNTFIFLQILSQIPQCTWHISHNATHTCVHISVTNWCIVGYEIGALWDLCDRSGISSRP